MLHKLLIHRFSCNTELIHLTIALELEESIRTHCSGETVTIIVKKESIITHSSGESKNFVHSAVPTSAGTLYQQSAMG